ncbi:MAG: hypothetical protein MUF48_13645 [Pirellulaceae bacterium]|jgi:hypothetical protein|nr:hypothetical protein [Pirellulaceae bacterium]
MTSGTANSSGPVLVAGTSLQHEQIIELQLARTRRRIKWVDLGCLAMGLAGSITTYLLIVVWIDHWVADLGEWGRLLALLGLALGVTYYGAAILVPPLLRRINPAYAARAIEQTNPSLKNSLLNFLTFRRDDSPTSRLVHQALRQRAAQDLRQVNVDLAVDRTRLIRIGYVVVALMALFAIYTILSPKNVFQTLHRVAAPWASITRPSRVSINDVQPGNVDLVYGARPTVSARIVGVRADESVQVRYSTVDRQTLARALPMQQAAGEARFASMLPEDTAGLQQDLVYWIEAGDARSPDFRLTVLPTPTILVERITYDYPKYTGRPRRVVEREGAIEALEGTKVTIEARTNHRILDARIEFDVDPQRSPEAPAPTSQPMSREDLNQDENKAIFVFTLRFTDPERSRPEHANYRLTFTTKGGLRSDESMIYRIAVFRDLPPEVAILTPRETAIELAADARQRIEIRALDPDYGLSSVVLHARTGGRNLLDQELLADPAGRAGQELLNYDFSPRHWQLQPGDQVTYWVSADDNRTSPDKEAPDPNTQRTRDYTMTIVGREPTTANAAAPSDDPDAADPEMSPPQNAQPQESAAAEGSQGASGSEGSRSPDGQEGAADAGESTPEGAPDTTPPPGGQSSGAPQDAPAQQSGDGQQQADQGDQQSPSDAGQSGQTAGGDATEQSDSQQPSDAGQAGSAGQSGAAAPGAEQSTDSSAGNAPGANAADGASGNDAGQNDNLQGPGSSSSAGHRPGSLAGGTGSQQTGTTPATGDAQSAPDGQATPEGEAAGDGQTTGQRREPLHDGEAFERALEHFRQESSDAASDGTPAPKPDESGSKQSSGDAQTTTSDAPGAEGSATDAAQQTGSADSPGGRKTPGGAGQRKPAAQPDGAGGDTPSRPEIDRDMQRGDGDSSGDEASPAQAGTQPGAQGASPSGAPGETPDAAAAPDAGDAQGNTSRATPDQTPGATDASGAAPRPAPRDPTAGESAGTDGGSAAGATQGPGDTPGKRPDTPSAPEAGDAPGSTPGESAGEAPGATATPGAAPPSAPGDQAAADDAGTAGETAQGAAERPSDAPANAGDPGGGMSAGSPQDGGLPGADAAVAPPADVPPAAADAVNLDYARRATDLVLERLRQDQKEPDPALLESLGWSAEDLRRFVARWEELKRAAREEGPAAQAELEDALRSLGLRPTTAGARRGSSENDQQRGLRDAGRGAPPPPEYRDLFNAYKKGAARGRELQGQRAP